MRACKFWHMILPYQCLILRAKWHQIRFEYFWNGSHLLLRQFFSLRYFTHLTSFLVVSRLRRNPDDIHHSFFSLIFFLFLPSFTWIISIFRNIFFCFVLFLFHLKPFVFSSLLSWWCTVVVIVIVTVFVFIFFHFCAVNNIYEGVFYISYTFVCTMCVFIMKGSI